MGRRGEFPYFIRQEVLKRGICEECGCGYDPEDPWEVHHKIYLCCEVGKQFPLAILTSLANAALVHHSCHGYIHNEWEEPPESVVAEVLKGNQAVA